MSVLIIRVSLVVGELAVALPTPLMEERLASLTAQALRWTYLSDEGTASASSTTPDPTSQVTNIGPVDWPERVVGAASSAGGWTTRRRKSPRAGSLRETEYKC